MNHLIFGSYTYRIVLLQNEAFDLWLVHLQDSTLQNEALDLWLVHLQDSNLTE